MRGVFIAFEGGEGAGKSTQLNLLSEHLQSQERRVRVTREPGGTPTAEAVRDILLAVTEPAMSDRCEVLLFAAARADHVAKVIAPALADGQFVLSDRYIDSSLAYQGYARGIPVADVARISSWATDGLVPDLTVVLDIEPEVGLRRAQDANRMEAEAASFHRQVRQGLLDLAAQEPDRYVVIDASLSAEAIAELIREAVRDRFGVPA